MRNDQVSELIEFGRRIEEKVTECHCTREPGIHFRDYEMTNFVKAAIELQHIQATKYSSNAHLVG